VLSLLADLNIPAGATQTSSPTDGNPNTADDGTLRETFDVDRNGDGKFTIADAFRSRRRHGPHQQRFLHPQQLDGVGEPWPALPAAGSSSRAKATRSAISLEPPDGLALPLPADRHQLPEPGERRLPGGQPADRMRGSLLVPDRGRRRQGSLAAELAAHGGALRRRLRSVRPGVAPARHQAFVSNPINLAIVPRPAPGPFGDDLKMDFFQIVDLADNNAVSMGPACAPTAPRFRSRPIATPARPWMTGRVADLVPFENVYTSTTGPGASSAGITASSRRVTRAPILRHRAECTRRCASAHQQLVALRKASSARMRCRPSSGQRRVDPSGTGVWVQSKFNWTASSARESDRWWAPRAARPGGQQLLLRIRTRGARTRTTTAGAHNIDITGVITAQVSPVPDGKPSPATFCPTTAALNCDETAAATDKGTHPEDQSHRPERQPARTGAFPIAGQAIFISGSIRPYRRLRDGDRNSNSAKRRRRPGWSGKPSFKDTPQDALSTTVLVRCSSDATCTSLTPHPSRWKSKRKQRNPGQGHRLGSVRTGRTDFTLLRCRVWGSCSGGTRDREFCITLLECPGGTCTNFPPARQSQCGLYVKQPVRLNANMHSFKTTLNLVVRPPCRRSAGASAAAPDGPKWMCTRGHPGRRTAIPRQQRLRGGPRASPPGITCTPATF